MPNTTTEIVDVYLKNAARIKVITENDNGAYSEPPHQPHRVLHIVSKYTVKSWYMDINGAEYGLTKVLWNAGDYEKNRVQERKDVLPFGSARNVVTSPSARHMNGALTD